MTNPLGIPDKTGMGSEPSPCRETKCKTTSLEWLNNFFSGLYICSFHQKKMQKKER